MNAADSFWIASTEDPQYPPLDREIGVPVAVVGGGITGLTTALELQKGGQTVVLLEAHSIGHGVTGSTTGKITASQGLVYSRLASDSGADVAVRYATGQRAALEHVVNLTEEHEIKCDLERVTNYVFAEQDEEVEALQVEAAAATRAGLAVEVIAGLDVPFPALAAVRLEGQGQFHARKYLLGLARAFVGAGGRIFQNSRVHAVETIAQRRVRLTLENGRVDADHAVLATHVPITMRGWFFARVHPYAAYAVAGPVAEDALEGMWINVGSPTHSLRTAPLDERRRLLIVVGEGHRVGQADTTAGRYEALTNYLTTHFPGVKVSYRWSTQDQYPVDGLPYIGQVGDDAMYVATGFAGWGLTNGTLAGMILSDAILRRSNEWASLFDPNRSSLVRAPRAMLSENLSVAKQLLAGKLQARPDSFDEIDAGTGAVVSVDGEKMAAFRDEHGSVMAVGASCTHLGCDVAWNDAERTWDCPCHGSRFTVTGDVIEGPAVEPLASVEIAAPAM